MSVVWKLKRKGSFVSLELPKRLRKVAFGGLGVGALLLLSGCSKADQETWKRVAMPAPISNEGHEILHLWQNAWIVAMITGVIVWGLIFYACFRFRRRSEDEIPVQMRYNLPIEVFYTLAPVVMVIVFFFFTVKVQENVDHDWVDKGKDTADVSITVVGQQWSWTFNYNTKYNNDYVQSKGSAAQGNDTGSQYVPATPGDGVGAGMAADQVYVAGTTANRPTLVLPAGKKVEFYLYSPDVIHSFWSTDFLFKMDVVPGRNNNFGIIPDKSAIGHTYEGRCAELCGVYHSRMLFDVKIVSPEDYDKYIQSLAATGKNSGMALGSTDNLTVPGLEAPHQTGEAK